MVKLFIHFRNSAVSVTRVGNSSLGPLLAKFNPPQQRLELEASFESANNNPLWNIEKLAIYLNGEKSSWFTVLCVGNLTKCTYRNGTNDLDLNSQPAEYWLQVYIDVERNVESSTAVMVMLPPRIYSPRSTFCRVYSKEGNVVLQWLYIGCTSIKFNKRFWHNLGL